jgi:hypothetical protein
MKNCPHCKRELADEAACSGCGWLLDPGQCERHPDREARGECVICRSAVCAECDAEEVREFICPAHYDVPIVDGWAQIYTTTDDVEAQLLRENLRSEGIDAELLSQKDHYAVPVDLGELSQVRLLVPAWSYTDARDVLARHMDEHGEVSFACTACGEAYDEGDVVCSTCGAELPPVSERAG